MSTKEWYQRLLKKNITHLRNTETKEWDMKPSRAEFIFPHIDHGNFYEAVRKVGLPSTHCSTLFKLKYDLFLTEERKFQCKQSVSNRCRQCSRVDFQGHYLICEGSSIKNIYKTLIELFRSNNECISLEKIVHMDVAGEEEVKYALGWILATNTDYEFKSRKSGTLPDKDVLRGILNCNLALFSKFGPSTRKYHKVISYLTIMIQSCTL